MSISKLALMSAYIVILTCCNLGCSKKNIATENAWAIEFDDSDLLQNIDKEVFLSGIAKNAKMGAILVSAKDDHSIIYINKLEEWGQREFGNKVVMSGTLRHIKRRSLDVVEQGKAMLATGPNEYYLLENARRCVE